MHNEFSRAYIADINCENSLLQFAVASVWLTDIEDGSDFGFGYPIVRMNILCDTGSSAVYSGAYVVSLQALKSWIRQTRAASESLSGAVTLGGWLDEKEVTFEFSLQHLGSIEASVKFVFEKEEHSYRFQFDQSYLAPALVAAKRFLSERGEST